MTADGAAASDGAETGDGAGTAAVTGATGFLGTHLCERLLENGWTVDGLCRPTSDRGGIDNGDDSNEQNGLEDVNWHVGDLFDRRTLESLVDGADAVFHLAGVGLWSATPDTVERVNRDGTAAVLRACRASDVGRLVFTSTAGTRRTNGTGTFADERDVAEPIGAYQRSKAAAEGLVDRYARTEGDAVTVHPTSIFGPGDGSFTAQLIAMGTEPTMPAYLPGGLSIVGVSDVVDGLLAAYRSGTSGEHYILGGENLTYDRAVSRISDNTGGSPARLPVPSAAIHAAGPVVEAVGTVTDRQVFPFDRQMARLATRRLFYTSQKAHEELGYEYEPLEAHLPETMSWYRHRRK
ncbi:NAD-dependent epimerase/dehydratase family protein [Natrarchaeobius halalkaliphilus]|uniref:NAD-dependent epimerase/dehydratase family protein n=1 Tax=Natrarchaeobius halalkaliphilus TaxID=1679091 RepID=A0A3N6LRZ5_9EURY|nr:NAD-dependent epimerase/dehydratase family protein [Natrarchaeobius halalkaliphilus]RQG91247.1 NAD-dependent epimerase/dehydratase family protein [Natrarchaeobius halalkaliphilus]